METIFFDMTSDYGAFKPLNATNGGAVHKRHAADQYRSNFEEYKRARIPYARNHDSQGMTAYGGTYSHDITKLFPRFEADPYDQSSYDFACTDEAILVTLEAGTKTFFRLGEGIEHDIKKHDTLPPPDFRKWAVICEHVIRHYTEGWADGFHHDMPYWEIWNEPDLDPDDSPNKRCWGGTRAQFFDMYETAAKHLKKCFPHLKIGGPASCGNEAWCEAFLAEMRRRGVPMDFFSWHIYTARAAEIHKKAYRMRALLDKYGYTEAESILNEWNYNKNWTDQYVYSLRVIHSVKGAAFLMAGISGSQAAPVDMLMYYDTRPSAFNGAFDYYTLEPLKGYYALYWYGMFYDGYRERRAASLPQDIYALCGTNDSGKLLCIVTYYTDLDGMPDREIALDFGRGGSFEIRTVDDVRTDEANIVNGTPVLKMKPNSFCLVREI
ncbi:MAG: hypothetical protein IK140_05495 [Clostridia bacterium]|nr:hypothetical protein [Clostridia bacterium]